jgi:putative transcriptional regulator
MRRYWIESERDMTPHRPFHGGIEAADLLRRMLPGGTETTRKISEFLVANDGDKAAAMMRDARGRSLNEAGLPHARPAPPVRMLRQALDLTQAEFAARFQIPLEVLMDWEKGVTQPDAAARAYLKVIARDPDAVRDALETDVSIA